MPFYHTVMWTLREEIEHQKKMQRMDREYAYERKILKAVPSRSIEVIDGPVVTANITDDGDYG